MTPTATPDPNRPARGWSWVHLAAVAVAAIAAAIVIAVSTSSDGGRRSGGPTTTELDAVEVTSDAPTYASLEQLVAAADVVVRAEVVDTAPGRWFGDAAEGSRLRSRLVTLDVSETLAGEAPRSRTVLVEEEGWDEDGRPLVVDGAGPSEEGDEGIWFLVDPGDATTGALIVANAQGRYLAGAGGATVGAAGDDPLVAELSSGSMDDLAARISRTPPRP